MIERVDFDKLDGLVPAVIQDADDGSILMVGFMNPSALERTCDEGRVTFWSRTKERLWQKGETSGNYLDVVTMEIDCDGDTLLIKARPRGPVCHTGTRSCFPNQAGYRAGKILYRLTSIISERKMSRPEGSYTTKLFDEGEQKIGQKVGEEAIELAIAAQYSDKQRCVEEAADLIYHTLVLLAAKEISLDEVEAELEKRMSKVSKS
ncbi:MAG TPA: bifunctional phosphoribosyl-AMP cyclohydrolase/phosphoribosyl-ATP diphosphatase HisIE [Blastocatellia bacterium]|nr:bifunctional phosphoribosyl-AMP cyclohydrolase/phosphoribosyl-ATP diphosphatase HisIE [Blastocatellia bacterium]